MSTLMTDEAQMRAIAEAVVAERLAQLRRELEQGEIARLRAAMEAGFARLAASVEALAEAQQRTEERLQALAARVDALAEAQRRTEERLEALTARVDALAEAQRRTEERLQALAARVDALAEAQRRTEERLEALTARVDALAEAQRRTEERLQALTARVDALAEAQRRTEERLEALTARVDALAEAQRRTEERLQALTGALARLSQRVGNLSGQMLEAEFGRKAPAYVGRLLRRARVMSPWEMEELVAPHLTGDELEDWSRTDWVVMGRPRGEPPDRPDLYLVVEVSGQVDASDVVRAARRAGYLRRAGLEARGCVFGHEVAPDAREAARSMGVLVFQDGRWMDNEGDSGSTGQP